MADKKNIRRQWIQNILNRYRLVVINETTFNEKYSFRISWLNIFVFIILLVTVLNLAAFFLVAFTPLKEFIPGYTSTNLRKEAIKNSFLLDSLTVEFQKQNQFINTIRGALTGEVNWEENRSENFTKDNPEIIDQENIRVKADSLLRLEVMHEDKYNLLPNPEGNVKFMLFPPVSGAISQPYDSKIKHYAVDIALDKGVPIKSIATGTVILADWTADTGYVIVIKHDYGLLSAYKHNASLEKAQGDTVQAGEVIAFAGNTGEISTGYHLHFELWIDGYPVDPTNFIDFSEGL